MIVLKLVQPGEFNGPFVYGIWLFRCEELKKPLTLCLQWRIIHVFCVEPLLSGIYNIRTVIYSSVIR